MIPPNQYYSKAFSFRQHQQYLQQESSIQSQRTRIFLTSVQKSMSFRAFLEIGGVWHTYHCNYDKLSKTSRTSQKILSVVAVRLQRVRPSSITVVSSSGTQHLTKPLHRTGLHHQSQLYVNSKQPFIFKSFAYSSPRLFPALTMLFVLLWEFYSERLLYLPRDLDIHLPSSLYIQQKPTMGYPSCHICIFASLKYYHEIILSIPWFSILSIIISFL